jgi:hypothetical protein
MKLDIEMIKTNIQVQLEEYSAIASLSGFEQNMMSHVQEYFPPVYPSYDFYTMSRNEEPYCAFLTSQDHPSKYVLVVHLDRVPDMLGNPYKTLPVEYDDYVQGQLDDIVGIAIAHYLYCYSGKPLSVLFTTREEETQSWRQIKLFVKAFSSRQRSIIPVGIDIDIFDKLPLQKGLISLRHEDRAGKMNLQEVLAFRKKADALSIPWTATEGHSITEIGYLSSHTRCALQGVHVGLPLTNYHTDTECIQWEAIVNVIQLLKSIITSS